MENPIKLFFEQHLTFFAAEDNAEKKVQLSSAALFMEMMAMDDVCKPKERAVILSLLQQNFALSPELAASLMDLAEQQRKQATDYFEFTSLINKSYSLEQKILLIEALWKIAFSDNVLDMQEEYLVRKIAKLLHIPDSALVLAKERAKGG